MAHRVEVELSVTDLPECRAYLERVRDFIDEYAGHTRDCAAYDVDGEWLRVPCSCGYDDALVALGSP